MNTYIPFTSNTQGQLLHHHPLCGSSSSSANQTACPPLSNWISCRMLLMLQTQHSQSSLLLQPVRAPPARWVAAAAAKKKAQKPKRRKPKQPVSQRIAYYEEDFEDEFEEDEGGPSRPADIRLMASGTRIPKAPAPKAAPSAAAAEPEDLYPVFPKQPKAVERLPGSSSSSTAAAAAASTGHQQQEPARLWNPRTGFMRTRAELEQQQAAAASEGSSSNSSLQGGTGQAPQSAAVGRAGTSSSSSVVERIQDAPNPLQPPQLPPSVLGAAAAAAGQAGPPGQLPAAGRGQVLRSCALTAAAMSGAAVGLSLLAAQQSAGLFGTNQAAIERLLQLPPGLQDAQQVGLMLGTAAAVTGARLVLKQQWPEFKEATDRSNQQVLTDLGWPDVALVAMLSGVSEELLFRWALIAGTWPDTRGVLLSGAVFGALHVTGGRNAAFAAWATAVGWLYGAAFLVSGNVWVPAGAHAIANFASAAAWISSNRKAGGGGGGGGGGQ